MSLIQNAGVVPRFRVTFHTNQGRAGAGNPMVTGDDWAWTIEEAKALALLRVQHSGIPGQAYVWEGEKCLWKYWIDFDARIFFTENPETAE